MSPALQKAIDELVNLFPLPFRPVFKPKLTQLLQAVIKECREDRS